MEELHGHLPVVGISINWGSPSGHLKTMDYVVLGLLFIETLHRSRQPFVSNIGAWCFPVICPDDARDILRCVVAMWISPYRAQIWAMRLCRVHIRASFKGMHLTWGFPL